MGSGLTLDWDDAVVDHHRMDWSWEWPGLSALAECWGQGGAPTDACDARPGTCLGSSACLGLFVGEDKAGSRIG